VLKEDDGGVPFPKVPVNLKGMPAWQTVSREVINQFKQTGCILRGYVASYGRPSFCKINSFLQNTLWWLGGSETRSIKRYSQSVRWGGGRVDSLQYLSVFNDASKYVKKVNFPYRMKKMASFLGFGEGVLNAVPLEEVKYSKVVNLSANPGPTFSTVGCTSKLESFDLAFDVATQYMSSLAAGCSPPKPLFSISGRAKLLTKDSLFLKSYERKPVGRAVWMADAHESILCACFTIPLMDFFKRTLDVVLLGFNKFTSDCKNLCSRFDKFDTFVSLDISKLDANVRIALTKYSFNLIRFLFKKFLKKNETYAKLLSSIEDWFINTQLVLPSGEIVQKPGGHPSGSDFISVINTICVSVAIVSAVTKVVGGKRGVSFDVGVYGDNSLIGFNTNSKISSIRRERGESAKFRICSFISDVFGLKVNPLESKVSTHFYVQVGAPLLPKGSVIKDFSSDHLSKYYLDKRRAFGRGLRPDERVVKMGFEPVGAAGGRTHRWTYIFAESPQFLSYYFKENHTMIRPTIEVIERLYNPERRPTTIDEHQMMLFSALVENYNNQHTVNRIMHYWYDSLHMKKLGILTASQAEKHNLLCFHSPPIPDDRRKLPFDRKRDGERAWYRRQRRITDIESSDCMVDFFFQWENVLSSCRRVYRDQTDLWWRVRKELRRERKTRAGLANWNISRDGRGNIEVQKTINYNAVLYGSSRYVRAVQSPFVLADPDTFQKYSSEISTGAKVMPGFAFKAVGNLQLR